MKWHPDIFWSGHAEFSADEFLSYLPNYIHGISNGMRLYKRSHCLGKRAVDEYRSYSFDRPVQVPALIPANDQVHVWMEADPFEFFTATPGITRAHGNVVTAGLGLGLMAIRLAQRKEVTSVTVVENSIGVIDLVKPVLPKSINIIYGDFLKLLPPADFAVVDLIWPYEEPCPHKKALESVYGPNYWAWTRECNKEHHGRVC